jgi:TatD DNase family protein
MYTDTHTHFDIILEESGISEVEVIRGLRDGRVSRAVQVSIEPGGFEWARKFSSANRHDGILFTAGIHPSSPADEGALAIQKKFVDDVMNSADRDLLLGIGECGLDYFRMRRPVDEQMKSFETQIALAKKHGLPVIVHSRDAMDDTLAVLKRLSPVSGIMHCFPGDSRDAKNVLDLGFYVSFAGNTTYPKALPIHEAAAYVPDERILLETDAPFLTPVPHRGKKNRSELISHTYEFIAKLRGIKTEALAESVKLNLDRLLDRSPQ